MPNDDPLSRFSVRDRVVLVTGAGGGIGREICRLLAATGAAVVVCADADRAAAETAADAAVQAGGRALAARIDVTDPVAVDQLVTGIAADHGGLHVLCTAAAILDLSSVMDMQNEDLERSIAVNLLGVFYCCRAAARLMLAQRYGSIVNFASEAIDRTTFPDVSAYAITKASVAQLTKQLALELGPSGVRANAVAPGYVRTGMTERRFAGPDGAVDETSASKAFDTAAESIPLRRIGQPADIAYAVLYLASEASAWVTGQILRPNGGSSMPW